MIHDVNFGDTIAKRAPINNNINKILEKFHEF